MNEYAPNYGSLDLEPNIQIPTAFEVDQDDSEPSSINTRAYRRRRPPPLPPRPPKRRIESLLNSEKEQKRSLAVEYTRLSLQFESALIQHKLALQYYEFRSYYFVFLPVTLIATSITIIGFLISGNTQTEDNGVNGDDGAAEDPVVEFEPLLTGQSKQILSLVVGILGAISTLFNAIGKRTNYQSQSDMHRSAVKALEKICLTVEFEKEWFDRNVCDIEYIDSGGNKKLVESLGADLKTHQASFKAMLDACCDSPVPEEVSQAFTLLEQLFHLHPFDNGGRFSDLSPLKFHYHKLWKEYSTYWLWPLKAQSIQVSKKYKEWKKEMEESYNDAGDDPVMGRRVLEHLSRDLRKIFHPVNQDAVQHDAPFVFDNLQTDVNRLYEEDEDLSDSGSNVEAVSIGSHTYHTAPPPPPPRYGLLPHQRRPNVATLDES